MTRHPLRKVRTVSPLLLLAGLGLCLSAPAATAGGGAVRIGVVPSLFHDVPAPAVKLLLSPFQTLMQSQTGLSGTVETAESPFDLGAKLENRQLQLGVFHGFEFAWAQEKYPSLRPLMLAVREDRNLSALLVARDDSTAAALADCKGQVVSLPTRSRAHCRLWLERKCEDQGCAVESFFARVERHPNVERALDDVLRGAVGCAVVDDVSLEQYKLVKPGCYDRLKVVQTSEVFPAAVIAYREGAIDHGTLERFRNGMLSANENHRGKQLMRLWKLTGFETVPADYHETLANIRKAYPAPEARTQPAAAVETNATATRQ